MNPSLPAVVVGVDGSPGALQAARWAAVEAAGRALPLRLVFAVDPLTDAGVDGPDRDQRVAEAALAEALNQTRIVDSRVEVVTEVAHATPVAALTRGVGQAAMICLGSSGARPAHPGHRTSTATEVILAADCPVAVVRGPAIRHGWVVVQVEAGPSLFDVLHVAVSEAALRALPLRLLTSWSARGTPSTDARDLDQRLRRDLDRWRRRFPRLDAVVVAAPDLDDFLRRNASHIALFVAPQRQTHDVGTVVHPSVETALRLLDCPVIIGAGAGRPVGQDTDRESGAESSIYGSTSGAT